MTQTDQILAHFLSGESLTGLEALRMYGAMRLAARVEEYEKEGYFFRDEWEKNNGKRYKRYWMILEKPKVETKTADQYKVQMEMMVA